MSEQEIVEILIALFLVEVGFSAFWALPGIIAAYRAEQGWTSPLFRALVWMDAIAVAVSLFFVPPSLEALHLLDLRVPFLSIGVTLGVMLLAGAVIVHRIAFDVVKRRRGHVSDNPDTSEPEGENE